MSTQTPTVNAFEAVLLKRIQALQKDRDHYKTLSEELKEALNTMVGIFGANSKHVPDKVSAALKKAQKDI